MKLQNFKHLNQQHRIEVIHTLSELLRDELVLQLICEDFSTYYELSEDLDKILSEDESPIKLITDLDSDKEVKKESDKKSSEVEDLLNMDTIIDKLEKENEENIDVNIKDTKKDKVHLTISSNEKDEELDDDIVNIQLLLRKAEEDILKDDDIEVNVKDIDKANDINVNIMNKKDEDNLSVKVNDKKKSSSNSDISVKIRSNKKKDNDKDSDIVVNLTNLSSNDQDDKTTLFMKKRDELIEKANPNMQLSVCLKIIVDLKKSLDRLINFIPDEVVLVRTKYIIGDMLDAILESNELILKDSKKLKNLIYKTFELVVSVNEYITNKYTQLEDKLDKQNKKAEDKQISKQLNDVEKIEKEKENDKESLSLDDLDNMISSQEKVPNVNKQKY